MHAGMWVRQALSDHHVLLEGTLLKPNMVCAGLPPASRACDVARQAALCAHLSYSLVQHSHAAEHVSGARYGGHRAGLPSSHMQRVIRRYLCRTCLLQSLSALDRACVCNCQGAPLASCMGHLALFQKNSLVMQSVEGRQRAVGELQAQRAPRRTPTAWRS